MGVVGGGSPLDRQIGIVEEALSEREAAIKDMVDAGVIDIQAAQALYDTERERVYEDFIAEQAGVMAGFESDMATAQAERTADRDALNAQLIAAGIDPALVADEFAMMDATYQGGRDAERDYLDAMGRIGTSADADRALLGEAVFGGFGQDLRSTGREMGLGAAMTAAQDRQTARERGLSSELLSPFTGVPEGVMFGGQYADVDTAGLQQQALNRASQERTSANSLAQSLALANRDFTQLSEAQKLNLQAQGIDPNTGEYLPFDPTNPYAGMSPAQTLAAMQADRIPLATLVSSIGLPREIVADIFNTLRGQRQEFTDENIMSVLGANPDVTQAQIAGLLELQANTPMTDFITSGENLDAINNEGLNNIADAAQSPTFDDEFSVGGTRGSTTFGPDTDEFGGIALQEQNFNDERVAIYELIGPGRPYDSLENLIVNMERTSGSPFEFMTDDEIRAEYEAFIQL
jgi:hypothetical protein